MLALVTEKLRTISKTISTIPGRDRQMNNEQSLCKSKYHACAKHHAGNLHSVITLSHSVICAWCEIVFQHKMRRGNTLDSPR